MSDAEFYRRLAEMKITPEMADECAHRLIAGAFRRSDKKPKFTIPTRHDDDDVVITEYIKRTKAEIETLRKERDKAQTERDRLRGVIERDRTKAAEIIANARAAVAKRSWLSEGRGSYSYDDETYQKEFGAAISELLSALEPLGVLAADWSDCPTDFHGARIDWKQRAEKAEARAQELWNERQQILSDCGGAEFDLIKKRDAAIKERDEAREDTSVARQSLYEVVDQRDAFLKAHKADLSLLQEAGEEITNFVSYGCPACGGDCASANPPVSLCPMQSSRAVLAKIKKLKGEG
jgi:hypothetical protein